MQNDLLDRVWDCTHPVICIYTDNGTEVVVYCPEAKEIEDDKKD